ncbi:MAG: ATP-binding domain-containing protein, partial [Atopobium minutum]|nr:ATP-binding domain-containing protein [Atopobium minutum]
LPKEGVILIDLALAKGLEFDEVIIPDAQATEYDNSDLSRRRLYTAISRAMHQVTILSQGTLSPALQEALADSAVDSAV